MSKQWQKRVERFKQIRSGGNDLFPEAVKSPATLPLPEKRPMSKRFSLKKLIKRLPREGDMFPQSIQKKELLDAVDRVLLRQKGWITRLEYLRECAHEIGAHYPDIAAMILERAGYSIWRLPLRNATRIWQRNYTDAAEYWQKAGNPEEREDTLLRATVLTLKENREQASWGKRSATKLGPLWFLAKTYYDEENLEKEYGVLSRIVDICLEYEDYVEAAGALASLASWHFRKGNWIKAYKTGNQVVDIYEQASDKSLLDPMYEADANFLMALSILYDDTSCCVHGFYVAIDHLKRAQEIKQNSGDYEDHEMDDIHRYLAIAWGMMSEVLLTLYYKYGSGFDLKEAKTAALSCLKNLEAMQEMLVSSFGRIYAMLSTIYTLLGELERAEDYRNKAMTLGYDLSEE